MYDEDIIYTDPKDENEFWEQVRSHFDFATRVLFDHPFETEEDA